MNQEPVQNQTPPPQAQAPRDQAASPAQAQAPQGQATPQGQAPQPGPDDPEYYMSIRDFLTTMNLESDAWMRVALLWACPRTRHTRGVC